MSPVELERLKIGVVRRHYGYILLVDICQFVWSFCVFSCMKLFHLGFRRFVGVDSSRGKLEQAPTGHAAT